MSLGHEVLAVDHDEAIVNEIAPRRDPRRPARRGRRGGAQGRSARPTSSTRSWRSRAASRRACSRRWRSRRWASPTSSRRRARSSTGRSSSGWAPTGSCSPSARWASGSPTRSRSGRGGLPRRRAAVRHRQGAIRRPGSWAGRSRDWTWSRLGLTPVALRRGDAVTVNPPRDDVDRGGRRADPDRPRRPPRAARPVAI